LQAETTDPLGKHGPVDLVATYVEHGPDVGEVLGLAGVGTNGQGGTIFATISL